MTRHLKVCPTCTEELIDVVVAHAALTSARTRRSGRRPAAEDPERRAFGRGPDDVVRAGYVVTAATHRADGTP